MNQSAMISVLSLFVFGALLCPLAANGSLVTIYATGGHGCTSGAATMQYWFKEQTCTNINGTGLYGTAICTSPTEVKFVVYARDTTCGTNSPYQGSVGGVADGETCLTTGPNVKASVTVDCSAIQPQLESIESIHSIPTDTSNTNTNTNTITNTNVDTSSPSSNAFFTYHDETGNSAFVTRLSFLALIVSMLMALFLQ